jgi:hypothetical protein
LGLRYQPGDLHRSNMLSAAGWLCGYLRVWLNRSQVLYNPKQRLFAPLLLRHAAADAAAVAAAAAAADFAPILFPPAVAAVVTASEASRGNDHWARATTRLTAVAAPIAAIASPKTTFHRIRACCYGSGNGRRQWIQARQGE